MMQFRVLIVAAFTMVQFATAADFPGLPAEEAALLNAIITHPDEDTPRLAYADWLDEHDDPLRAEFIRLQVKLYRTDSKAEGFAALEKRQEELLAMPKATRIPTEYFNQRKVLMEQLLPKEARDSVEQSFLTDIQRSPLKNKPWLDYANWLAEHGGLANQRRAARITHAIEGNFLQIHFGRGFPEGVAVSQGALEPSGMDVLNALPFVRKLTVSSQIVDPQPQLTATILGRLKYAGNVQALTLFFSVSSADITLMAPSFTSLKHLQLDDPALSALQTILAGPWGPRLESLSVRLGDAEQWGSHETHEALRTAFARWAARNPQLKEMSRDLHGFLPPHLQKTVKIINDESECSRFLTYFVMF